MQNLARIVPWILCVLIYWPGLRAWFQMDDFAWLSLHLDIDSFGSFWKAMFQPLAQGTIRPWTERLFFIAGWHLFGMEAAPYRAIVFATMFVNLWLLGVVTQKLTRSRVAGFAAPVLWLCNGNLYTPMSWTSAYNQVLCATFLLTALLLWIRYTETGETRWYAWQWVVFVLGFGALEINLVYPAIAALYACCFARRYVWRTLPMFAFSALFAVAHRLAAPPQSDDVYRMYFDARVFDTLATYFGWSLSAHRYASFRNLEVWPFYVCAAIAGAALVAVCLRRDRMPLFCIGWFVAVIAPVLPLRNHRSDYYLTIPVVGLAILGAYGLSLSRRWWRGVALTAALAYAIPGAWMAHGMSGVIHDHSSRVKHLLRGIAGAARQHPGDVLLISGVDNALFWRGWSDSAFRSLRIPDVYLASDTRPAIEQIRAGEEVDRFFLADATVLAWLQKGKARVYQALADGRLRETTGVTRARLERTDVAGPVYLDVRLPVYSMHIGPGWWPAERNHRWMSQHATVELRGPLKSPGELVVRGWLTPQHVQAGPVQLAIAADGTALPPVSIGAQNLHFEVRRPLPANLEGKKRIMVELTVDRPLLLPTDGRQLGAAFGTFQVKP